MIKVHPAGHRVLVKLKAYEEKSAGGILLCSDTKLKDAQKRATQEATVIEIGRTAFKAFDDGHPWCAVGDKVLIAKYSGEDREDQETGDIYRLINDEDIFAVLGD